MRPRSAFGLAAFGLAHLVLAGRVFAQQPLTVSTVTKSYSVQSATDVLVTRHFEFNATATLQGAVVNGLILMDSWLALPQRDQFAQVYAYTEQFSTLAGLMARYPDSDHFMQFGSSPQAYAVTLRSSPFPLPARVTNFDEGQAIANPGSFVLRWERGGDGGPLDYLVIAIRDLGDTWSFSTPDIGATSGRLPGATSEITLSLPTNKRFVGTIGVYRRSDGRFYGDGVIHGFAGALALTEFTLSTELGPSLPQWRSQSNDVTATEGGSATFEAVAYGSPAPAHRWQRRRAGENAWSDVADDGKYSGAHTHWLRVTDLSLADSGLQLRCVAANVAGDALSNPRTLTVVRGSIVSTFAGAPGQPGTADGPGPVARFTYPLGIAAGSDGALYVTDANHTIRKITRDGNVTSFSGTPNISGSVDGPRQSARFFVPGSIAADSAGNLYVCDGANLTIRKITFDGVVTTLAGLPEHSGTTDGVGSAARFARLRGICADLTGTVYVTDDTRIRKIGPGGVVSTISVLAAPSGIVASPSGVIYVADQVRHVIYQLSSTGSLAVTAGVLGESGSDDGPSATARFHSPTGLALDSEGALLVADAGNHVIRKVSPTGTVTTLAGYAEAWASADGLGAAVRFNNPLQIAPGEQGRFFVVDYGNKTVRKGERAPSATIQRQPVSSTLVADEPVGLSVEATPAVPGTSVTFQWRRNGNPIPGATNSTFGIPSFQEFSVGTYDVVISGDGASVVSSAAQLALVPLAASNARLTNLSTRALALTGDNVLIPGFVIAGPGNKELLIRAVGPTLAGFGVPGTLPDPRLTLKRWNGTAYDDVASNDNWGTNPNAAAIVAKSTELFAFPLAAGSADAALLVDLAPGQYSAVAGDAGTATGIAIVELYDADTAGGTARLINISNRGYVGAGDSIMIPGFVVSSEGPKTLLIRAVGPTLGTFGVTGVLADPTLSIYRRNQTTNTDELILTNDDWSIGPGAARTRDVAAQIQAFALPAGSKDAAFVVTLNPGIYTVHARGANNTTGVALVEVYAVP